MTSPLSVGSVSTSAPDYRRHKRVPIRLPAAVMASDRRLAGEIRNVSIGGLLVAPEALGAYDDLKPGDIVSVIAPGLLDEAACRVVMISAHGVHLSFEENQDFSLDQINQARRANRRVADLRRYRDLARGLFHMAYLQIDARDETLTIHQSTLDWLPADSTRPVGWQVLDQCIDLDFKLRVPDMLRLRARFTEGLANLPVKRVDKSGAGRDQILVLRLQPQDAARIADDERFIALLFDATAQIADRREARALSAALADVAESSARELGHLAHDLQTPLGAIKGYGEMLLAGLQGPLGEAQRASLTTICDAAATLSEMTHKVITNLQSAPLAAETTGERRMIDVVPIIEEIATLMRPIADAADNHFELDLAADLAPLPLDPIALRRILTNLVSNALKFTHHGSVTISVEPVFSAGAPSGLQLVIADTGIGIAQGDQQRVFEPFVRLGERAGHGMGLAITRSLVQREGGSLTLASEPGVGTRVTIQFSRG